MNLSALTTHIAPLKKYAGFAILLTTIGLFGYYLSTHPAIWRELRQLNPLLVLGLLGLYGLMLLSLASVYDATVRLCGARLPRRENLLLTAYSTIVNFFGPLQSGPGFRALYLKKRHKVSIKTYTVATLIYYLFYGFFSAMALVTGAGEWWVTGSMTIVMIVVLFWVLPRYMRRFTFNSRAVTKLAMASLLQVVVFGLIYFVELRSVDPQVTIGNAISYAGTANLSLFASLTPGAIGIREAFLFFTQNLHHVADATIVTASVIDRAVYVVFLGILLLGGITLHAKDHLHIPEDRQRQPPLDN